MAGTPRYALVIAGLTVAAVKVRHAKTLPLGVFPRGVGHRAVHQTNPAVEAVVAVALPQENVARHTRPPETAGTDKSAGYILAGSLIAARCRQTLVQICLAEVARETLGAAAVKIRFYMSVHF